MGIVKRGHLKKDNSGKEEHSEIKNSSEQENLKKDNYEQEESEK